MPSLAGEQSRTRSCRSTPRSSRTFGRLLPARSRHCHAEDHGGDKSCQPINRMTHRVSPLAQGHGGKDMQSGAGCNRTWQRVPASLSPDVQIQFKAEAQRRRVEADHLWTRLTRTHRARHPGLALCAFKGLVLGFVFLWDHAWHNSRETHRHLALRTGREIGRNVRCIAHGPPPRRASSLRQETACWCP
jgi:hypothetical protein